MGIRELIDFIGPAEPPKLPQPIGWGIPGLPWSDCDCEMCGTLQTLSRPEIAFVIKTLADEHPDVLVRMTLAIEEARRRLLAGEH